MIKLMDIDPDEVFSELKRKRETGELSAFIADGKVRYQASRCYAGMLEKVYPNGEIQTGKFVDGSFVRVDMK